MKDIEEQIKIIQKGADEIINIDELKEKIRKSERENRPLTIKLGLDPTAPDIHLGHAVVLRKIKQLQDLGHRAVIIIGDFTGMIGDPTGKSKTRKQLTREEVVKNAVTYEKQIYKILDKDKTEMRFNSVWLSKLNCADVVKIASKYTVTRMLEREDFNNRFKNQQSIGIHEFIYPLLVSYDSVEVKADIELGGTDQRFNILLGRTIQREFGMESQVAVFMPILEGTDGIEKMSKSLGNYIGINEQPDSMYTKVMQIPDDLIVKYFELATDVHPDEIEKIKEALKTNTANPRDIKMRLAREIVALYHGDKKALSAQENFVAVYQKNQAPENLPQVYIKKGESLIDAMTKAGFANSNSEAKRLIIQGGVKINNRTVLDYNDLALDTEDILKVGKAKFAKIIIK